MADPSLAELHALLAAVCALPEKVRLAGLSHTQNIQGLQDSAVQLLEGDYADALAQALGGFRARYASAVADASTKALLDPLLKQYALRTEINSPHTDPLKILDDIAEYFNSVAVAAQGTLTLDTEPADGDTMTIGAITYRFKTTMAAAEDIKRGDGLPAVKVRVAKILNGDNAVVGTDFYAGSTTPHPTVKAAQAFSGDALVLTARSRGTAGNSLTTTETFTAGTNVFDAATLGTTTAGVSKLTVASRVRTYNSFAAASGNIGTVDVLRVTSDWNENSLEGVDPDKLTLIVDRAEGEGAQRYRSDYRLYGRPRPKDRLLETNRGAGEGGPIKGLIGSPLLADPSFSTILPATDNTQITDLGAWSASSLTGLKTSMGDGVNDEGNEIYRAAHGDPSPKAIDFTTSNTIYQLLRNRIDASAPWVCQLAYLPENSAAGVIYMRVRVYTNPSSPGPVLWVKSVAISGSSWALLRMALDFTAWSRNWAVGQDLALEIHVQLTAGNVVIDDVTFDKMTQAPDGTWVCAIERIARPRKNDKWTVTDTENGAIVQRHLGRAYRKSLPSTSGTPTVTEPTVT